MGIGGAGHMGNREIAEFLIGQGARFDIFVAAMLGRIDVSVRSSPRGRRSSTRRGRTASR